MNAKNVALAVGAALVPSLADAATITVNSLADAAVPTTDGNCTLREAIANANNDAAIFPDCVAGAGADTITFSVTGTIVMAAAPEFEIQDDLTIAGPGPSGLVIDAQNGLGPSGALKTIGTFDNLTVSGITIRDSPWTGIKIQGTSLNSFTLRNTVITGNSSPAVGGGLYLYSVDTVTITDSVISGNSAVLFGGGVYVRNVTDLTISDSEISDNTRGGVRLRGTNFDIVNATIANNTSPLDGAGVALVVNSAGTIRLSTISGNGVGSSIDVSSTSQLTLENTIVANNTFLPDITTEAPATVTANYSLIENPTGASITGTGNITGVDPQLGPLQNNGGSTRTMLPSPGSPVIDAGDPAFTPPPSTDQRGFQRPVGRVDIGAVEVSATHAAIPTLSQWMLLALAGVLASIAGLKLRD